MFQTKNTNIRNIQNCSEIAKNTQHCPKVSKHMQHTCTNVQTAEDSGLALHFLVFFYCLAFNCVLNWVFQFEFWNIVWFAIFCLVKIRLFFILNIHFTENARNTKQTFTHGEYEKDKHSETYEDTEALCHLTKRVKRI